ncbi:Long-chain-fatty-acid--CoA ligase FadD13 (plasmid) [Variovorax sp. SRS16]|uniref:acyl-CoA synthetase n=1 Tax=Variovorax sp. SRS16 TaxID=282217 RepID=UPI001316A82B|nr:long-chain fatty acid--CoA ligase [Variovorax sp. SRS16]VTU45509.1 Long-chain-fatty-acid--CoA ligase FadD13 [Variovorax sp. SRS16]
MQITSTLERAAQRQGERPGTVCGERTRSWRSVLERTRRVAGALREMGIAQGERVAVLSLNNDRYVELLYAVPWAGGVIVPLNIRWSLAENLVALQDADATVLCVDDSFADMAGPLADALPGLARTVYLGDAQLPDGMLSYEASAAQAEPVADAHRRDDDLYAIFYTGGTTGRPKGVMLSHRNAYAVSVSWMACMPQTEPPTHLHVGGLFHLSGAGYTWYTTMACGTNVMLPKFETTSVMNAIERHRVTSTMMMPTMVNMLLADPAFAHHDLRSVRTCIYGGSPIPDALLAAAIEKLPTWGFVHSYGMTETSGMTLMLPASFCVPGGDKLRSCGRASHMAEVIVAGPDGLALPPGEIGEILMRGQTVTTGYWRNPAGSAEALRNGWIHSGDAAWMDAEGFFYIVDRLKDMIVSGGENVYSAEVENALSTHPGVLECAVIGTPDERWGERVTAIVVARAGHLLDERALIAHCRDLIANYKCPRAVMLTDALPKSAAGKINKVSLREPYWAGHARRVN